MLKEIKVGDRVMLNEEYGRDVCADSVGTTATVLKITGWGFALIQYDVDGSIEGKCIDYLDEI